jgi:hypothetical protein
MSDQHLAQLNIGHLLAPLTSPDMAEFVSLLDEINAIADADPGFVWRMTQADSDPTPFERGPGDLVLVNMSVWRDLDALGRYVYTGAHAGVMRRRREWFSRMTDMHMVLWWIPAGHVPTVAEGAERLARLAEHGPTASAFTFRTAFAAA